MAADHKVASNNWKTKDSPKSFNPNQKSNQDIRGVNYSKQREGFQQDKSRNRNKNAGRPNKGRSDSEVARIDNKPGVARFNGQSEVTKRFISPTKNAWSGHSKPGQMSWSGHNAGVKVKPRNGNFKLLVTVTDGSLSCSD